MLLAVLLSRAFPRGKEAAGLAELLGGGTAESSEPFPWCPSGRSSGRALASAKQNSFSGTEHSHKKEQECNTIVLPVLVPNLLRP